MKLFTLGPHRRTYRTRTFDGCMSNPDTVYSDCALFYSNDAATDSSYTPPDEVESVEDSSPYEAQKACVTIRLPSTINPVAPAA